MWNGEIDQFLDNSIQEMEIISQAALENGVMSAAEGEEGGHDKSTSTKDIGEGKRIGAFHHSCNISPD